MCIRDRNDRLYTYMFGVNPEVIELGASDFRTLGSLKSWKLPINAKMSVTTNACRIAGSLIARMI